MRRPHPQNPLFPSWPAGVVLVAALGGMACVPKVSVDEREALPEMVTPVPSGIDFGSGTGMNPDVNLDPYALLGIQPNHGPFSGGQLAILRGNGFTPEARVWIGGEELPKQNVQPVDSKRLQIVIPAGSPGPVDVATQNGDATESRRTLVRGYTFDTFVVSPDLGPTAGGTEVRLQGKGTAWNDTTQVYVDAKPCSSVRAVSAEELVCVTPPGSTGAKPVSVQTSDGVAVDVVDAFAYSDSKTNFRGGLSGNALNGKLEVLVLDRNMGTPLAGAAVVVGSAQKPADATGRAVFEGPELLTAQPVTVAAKCYQPMTFAQVPVETATIYLDPVLSPACGMPDDVRLTGGASIYTESVEGELFWPDVREFQAGGWTNVPTPKNTDEQRAAYVFPLATDPATPFVLPETYDAVTPSDITNSGYRFSLRSYPDTVTLYALAGIENRKLTPPLFIPYAMGITRGVKVEPEQTKSEVFLAMSIPIDQGLNLQVAGPEVTSRGPNRMDASVAVGIPGQGYVILPGARQKGLYPAVSPLSIVGLPPLVDRLSGSTYVATATVYTGESGGVPRSRGALLETPVSGQLLMLDRFVQIPKVTAPLPNTAWNGRSISLDWANGNTEADLLVLDISSGGGLVHWTVVVPGGTRTIELPDLRSISTDLGILPGGITLKVSAASIENFQYGKFSYGDLSARSWAAYAVDVVDRRYSP